MDKLSIAFQAGFQKEAQKPEEYFPDDIDKDKLDDQIDVSTKERVQQGALGTLLGGALGGSIGGLGGSIVGSPRVARIGAGVGALAGGGSLGYVGAMKDPTHRFIAEQNAIDKAYDDMRRGEISEEDYDRIYEQIMREKYEL